MANKTPSLVVLPGDGIGPEVIREAVRVLDWFRLNRGFVCEVKHGDFGVGTWHKTGKFMSDTLRAETMEADAVLFGATGGTADHLAIPQEVRRREGLLRVRKDMNVYANIRPIKVFPALADTTVLRPEVISGANFVIVRELLGGVYFGHPRGIEALDDGQRRGYNTQSYATDEVKRIARVAFELARLRSGRVTSVDKANVLESSEVWRGEVIRLQQTDYPDVQLDHMYVDNATIQVVRYPTKFDVLLTDNLFGDILSDCASTVAGSLGMLPSASLSDADSQGRRRGLFEPAHGSAPDIAGQNKANPLAAILSLGMAFSSAFKRRHDASLLDLAVAAALENGARTGDIALAGTKPVSTSEMGDAVLSQLAVISASGYPIDPS